MRLLIGLVLLGLVGCTRSSELRDQFQKSDYHLPFDQRLRFEIAAPVIVLATVLETNDIGRPQRSRGDPRIKTQLTRLKIDVEQVIKGDAPNPLEFYYFTYSQENDISLGVPRYIPMVGNRRIYFLKLTDKGYRSVGDVTNYTLTIASGHQVHGFCDGKTPVCCLAELLLVPQPDFDNKWFAGSLIIGESVAETLCSRLAAFDLVRRLTSHPDKHVSESANEVLAAMLEPPRPPQGVVQ